MKKKILAYALSALTCGLFTSCSDWLDINHDPNTAEKVDPGYLFNYAAVNWAGTRTGGDFYIPLSMSSQCQVDGGLDYGGWMNRYIPFLLIVREIRGNIIIQSVVII